MKNLKNLALAALAAASVVSSHAAGIETGNQKVYITGSTGFRATVNKSLYSLYSNNIAVWDGGTSFSELNLAGAKNLAFTNVNLSGVGTVDVICAFGGSEAGIQCTAAPSSNKKFPFYDLSKILTASGTTASVAGGDMTKGSNGVSTYTTAQSATITFADNAQNVSAFTGAGAASDGTTYRVFGTDSGTGGQRVAVIPFNIYGSKNFPVSDMNQKAFLDLCKNGAIYGSQLINDDPNNLTATNWTVHFAGRNIDSGTRVQAMLMAGYGTTANVKQQAVTASGGVITVFALEPAGSINGIAMSAGNNGQSSGGTLIKWLTNGPGTSSVTVPGAPANLKKASNFVSTYCALPDAVGQYTNGIVPLTWNGVEGRCYSRDAFTNSTGVNSNGFVSGAAVYVTYLDQGYTNIITGRYPYWGYEYCFYNTNQATGSIAANATTNIYSALLDRITNYSSTDNCMFGAIKLNDMKVQRTTEGDRVIPGAALQ